MSRHPAPVWAIEANSAAAKIRAAQRIEDVEDLLSFGRPLPEIVERAGFPSMAAAGRYLYRHGRPDLARPFSTMHDRSRVRSRVRRRTAQAA